MLLLVVAANLPATQSVQLIAPLAGAWRPAAHAKHSDARALELNHPGEQAVHVLEASGAAVPGWQREWLALATSLGQALPAGQMKHTLEDAPAYRPRPQP